MPGWYGWGVALGIVGVACIAGAATCSVLGMMHREPEEPLPRYVGWALGQVVLGSLSFIGSLLIMVAGTS